MPTVPQPVTDLLAVTGGDPLVRRRAARYRTDPAWRLDGAVAFVCRSADGRARSFTALGDPVRAAELVAAVLHDLPEVPWTTMPRDAAAHLPEPLRLEEREDWDFRSTATPPPPGRAEGLAAWLGEADFDDVRELLTVANPTSSTWPGEAKVNRWAGVRGADGRLSACLADTSVGGVGHLAAITTRPEERGRGLGAAITAWATRRLFEEGCDTVTLAVFADNDGAQRLYDRLGFGYDHRLTSGVPLLEPLPPSSTPGRYHPLSPACD